MKKKQKLINELYEDLEALKELDMEVPGKLLLAAKSYERFIDEYLKLDGY